MKRLVLIPLALLLLLASPALPQTANIAPAPGVYTALDNNGFPCSGCKLFTYQAGTTTKVPSYTTASESTQNTNPVILDSSGRAQIFLDPGTIYKFVLSPSNDTDPPSNPFWTTDNINPNTFTVASLAGVALFTQQEPSGTASPDTGFASGSYHTDTLTTTTLNTISGASLASSQITLPTGTYYVEIKAVIENASGVAGRLRWRNITDSTTTLNGPGANFAGGLNGVLVLSGMFTITGNKAFSVQMWPNTSSTTGGTALTTGEVETYVTVSIEKVG